MSTRQLHPAILEALAGHGLLPPPEASPARLRDAVRDLYRYEIRRLRTSLLAGHILKRDYVGHVIELRERYWILSVPLDLWTQVLEGPGSDPGTGF